MCKEMSKNYNPKESEERIYKLWEENGYFEANIDSSKKPFTIVMPPPNITGNLHMGHALDQTMQDVVARFKRMQGFSTLWIPGTDHASIATEAKIVEQMRKEGISKEEIGRDKFLERAWERKKQYGGNITKQIRKLGSSCDWKKERFTMDKGCSKAVKEFFVRLYEKGLIYRGERIINWCPKCLTSISDSEVEFKESDGNFWHINYNFADGSGYLTVATTRPETMFGDVAIAVNPEDDRYKHLIGKEVIIPVVGRKIPIIGDSYVDVEVGTGVLKITPAHDPNDFEVGVRHNLKAINVMDEAGYMNENASKYSGLERYEARRKLVEELKELGHISKIESIKHNVGKCYRCSETVEPRISTQWFVKMESLAKKGLECVKAENIKFIPERFTKIYYHWMENIKDWCISRQLWWGHRIPAWYCEECGEVIVSKDDNVDKCSKCSSTKLRPEEDTLDTWFSSGLWPFSVLGWPDKTPEMDYFYPANVLVTGHDLIFFWIAKMIFSSLEMTDKPPFERILVHGLVRDSQGRKMSKSLGNGIDPLEIIEKYGADALRFSLVLGNSPGNDLRFFDEKVESSRNFANKIWNAARFIHMKTSTSESINASREYDVIDKWIISRLNKVINEVTIALEKLDLGLAAQKLYDFIWDEFCDWYIEFSKLDDKSHILLHIMENILKLIHPFMPFLTEEIWSSFSFNEKALITAKYPVYDSSMVNEEAENNVEALMTIIKSVRNMRREMNIPQNKKTSIYIEATNDEVLRVVKENLAIIGKLSYAKEVDVARSFDVQGCTSAISEYAKVYIPLNELIDKDAELTRLRKELKVSCEQLENTKRRLQDKNFTSKAPAHIIKGAEETVTKLESKIEKLNNSIKEISEK